jgi:thymidylate kinase
MGKFGQQIRALYNNRNGVTPEQELELFLADRREHVQNLLMPALMEGKIVLCDRYFLSTAAYQGCLGDTGRSSTIPGSSDTHPSLASGHSSTIPGSIDTQTSLAFGHSSTIPGSSDTHPSLASGHSSTIPGSIDTQPCLAYRYTPEEIIDKNSFAPAPDLALLFYLSPQVGIQRITTGRGDILNDFEHEAALVRVAAIFESLNLPYIHRIDASGSIESVSQSVLKAVRPLLLPLDRSKETS